jgi:hypothetical protein
MQPWLHLVRHRMDVGAEARYLEKIRLWADDYPDCLWLDKVEPYRSCRVAGVVRRLRLDPASSLLETTISDGKSMLRARWPLERSSPLLRAVPGTGVILEGMVLVDPSGEAVLAEPAFELTKGPEWN